MQIYGTLCTVKRLYIVIRMHLAAPLQYSYIYDRELDSTIFSPVEYTTAKT